MPGRVRRCINAFAFLAAWAGIGWCLRLPSDVYHLGALLAVAFQVLVLRLPLRALWVRDAPPFWLDGKGNLIAIGLAVTPGALLVGAIAHGDWRAGATCVCGVLGAIAAAYAICQMRRETLRPLLLCVVSAGAIGIGFLIYASPRLQVSTFRAERIVVSFLQFFPLSFMFEEALFRGAIDSHIHHPGEGHGWLSALLVALLWGLWHLPVVPNPNLVVALGLVTAYTAVGVPLSIGWRQSGNLAVPALAHALIDAVRSAGVHS